MKRFSMILLSIVLLTVLVLGFQSTAFAASFRGSPTGKHVTTIAPNCASVVGKAKETPDCTPYPRCTATGCYNLDPYAEGCGTATTYNQITVKSAYIPSNATGGVDGELGVIYNYYSPFCNANWAQVTMYQDPGRAVMIDIDTTDTNGHYEKQCEPTNCTNDYDGTSYPAWTNMIDGTNSTTACALVSNADGTRGDCVSQ